MTDPDPEQLADRLWTRWRPRCAVRQAPERPVLVVVSGVPLTGKTTLSEALVEHATREVVHVENDRVRREVLRALGRSAPVFDAIEDELTYEVSRCVVERVLGAGYHAIHDATNLTEATREEAYALADRLDADVGVVVLDAEPEVLEARAQAAGPADQQAYQALGDRDPSPTTCQRPTLVLDAAAELTAKLERVLAAAPFGVLAPDGTPDRVDPTVP